MLVKENLLKKGSYSFHNNNNEVCDFEITKNGNWTRMTCTDTGKKQKMISSFSSYLISEKEEGNFVRTLDIIPSTDVFVYFNWKEVDKMPVPCKKNIKTTICRPMHKVKGKAMRLPAPFVFDLNVGDYILVGNETLIKGKIPSDIWMPCTEDIDVSAFKVYEGEYSEVQCI